MENLWQDIKYGSRMLLHNPGFTLVAALSLALGIGANTTIFSLVNALLLRALPVEDPGELVWVYTSDFSGPPYGTSSYPDFLDFRGKGEAFSGVLASSSQPLSMSSDGVTERVLGEIVTGNYFTLLGVKPALGRTFLPEEDQSPGKYPVAIVSHGMWQRRFGSDPGLLGRTIALNGHLFTVVGIARERFTGVTPLLPTDIWVPMMMQQQLSGGRDRLSQRGSRWLTVLGRLKPGVPLRQAQASFQVLASQLKETYPQNWIDVKQQGRRLTLVPESETRVPPPLRGAILGFMSLLMGVVGLVLLIACANIANLLLARATRRRKEIAIRLSLGAAQSRLLRQLLTESILLSVLGGALGLVLAFWTTGLLLAFKPPIPLPIALDFSVDARVLVFTLLLSILTGIFFGLAPALHAARPDLVPALKDESGAAAGGFSKSRLRSAFVVAQVALSLLLLIAAGLFLRSLRNAHAIDPGFDPSNVLLMSVDLRLQGYSQTGAKEFCNRLLERVRSLPGVASASLAASTPLSLVGSRRGTFVEGYNRRPGEDMEFHYNVVAPEYFQTMRIKIVRGRPFTPQDTESAPGVVIVNETFARRFWSGQDSLGKRFSISGPQGRLLEVVGIASDGKYNTLGEDPTPFFYLPAEQNFQSSAMTLLVRTATDPEGLLAPVRAEFRTLDKNLPVTEVKTLVEHMGLSLFPARAAATLLGIFGAVALLLAAVGIYGVMSFAVSQRTHEIGIRIALGARPGDVLKLVVRQGMALTTLGLMLGLIAAYALTRLLASLLYGISVTDPVTFSMISLLLALVAFLASYIPARRATRIDPLVALRYE